MKLSTALNPFMVGTVLCLPLIIFQACSSSAAPQGWWQGNGPVIPHDNFPGNCSLCHEGSEWNEVRLDFEFDHFEQTGVRLEGAHSEAQCLRCHNDRGPVASFAAAGCAGCHEDVHLEQLGRNCESCHGVETWQPQGQIEKHMQTRFPLVGAHAATACFRCHTGSEVGLFTPTDTACESCHSDLAANVTAPSHLTQGWLNNCQDCHLPTSWRNVGGFGHENWPLTGAHAATDCTTCHTSGQFVALPSACFSCHDTQYLSTTNPDHIASGFPTSCEDCHGTNTWQGANFNHSFPISGAHAGLNCTDCHTTNNPPVFSCIDCHGQGATANDHDGVSGYSWNSAACLSCHPDGRG